jgi:hypothetical protein
LFCCDTWWCLHLDLEPSLSPRFQIHLPQSALDLSWRLFPTHRPHPFLLFIPCASNRCLSCLSDAFLLVVTHMVLVLPTLCLLNLFPSQQLFHSTFHHCGKNLGTN